MTDAFYMLMLMAKLGDDYMIWDKAASHSLSQAGHRDGAVRSFVLAIAQIEDIREKLKTLIKYEPVFKVDIKDEQGIVIAEVEKMIYIRKRESDATAGRGSGRG